MAGKKSGSDNPWAEMSRLNLNDKEAKAPAPDSPRAATIKSDAAKEEVKPPAAKEEIVEKTTVASGAVATKIEEVLDTEEEGEEVAEIEEVVEYSADELEEMSLKELQAIAKESGVDFKGLSKEELIDAIIEETGSVEEEEEILLEDVEESDEEELEEEEIDGEMSLEEAMALLGEDSETEEDFSDVEFEEVEEVVQEGDASFELDDNNSNG
jgi:hypothetical protein